jgi:uncharacterized protein
MAGKFELFQDKKGEYRWRLRHQNGQIIADSGEGYSSRAAALNGINSVKTNVAQAAVKESEPAVQPESAPAPAQAPAQASVQAEVKPAPAPAPAPVKAEIKPEPAPAPAPIKAEVKPEPAPAPVVKPTPTPVKQEPVVKAAAPPPPAPVKKPKRDNRVLVIAVVILAVAWFVICTGLIFVLTDVR